MEHLKDIKRALTAKVEAQMGNLEHVNTHELGEAIDMIKDLAEAMYHCSIVEAMEKAEEESKNGNSNSYYYTERYLPYPYYNRNYYDDGRDMGNRMSYGDRRYAENPRDMGGNDKTRYYEHEYDFPVRTHDAREGQSGSTRRKYMEGKALHHDKEVQMKELEHYMSELSKDVTEMIQDASPEEKTLLHKKLNALANKIELLNKD